MAEVAVIEGILHELCRHKIQQPEDTTIMTAYRAQKSQIKLSCPRMHPCRITTIDAMQGLEDNLVIVSLVRTGDSIGFLQDAGRLSIHHEI